jgi:hypothetical protein
MSRTSNGHYRLCLLASDEEDDIALRRVDIVVLEEEWLINTVLLQGRELDKQIQRTGKRLLEHEVLLPSDLDASALVANHAAQFYLTLSSNESRSRRALSVMSEALKGIRGAIIAELSRRIKETDLL